jgi:hypothetical protein
MANFVFKGIQQVKALPASPEKGVLYFVREFANGEATGNMSVYFGSRCYGKVEATRLAKIESDILALDGRVDDIESTIGAWTEEFTGDLKTIAQVVSNHESRIVTAEGNASAAVDTANSAKDIANEAKQIAQGAVTDVTEQVKAAEAAQTAAEAAQTAAEAAKVGAESAKAGADAAQSGATEAKNAAAQSAADAEDAKDAAVVAQGAAETAQAGAVAAQGKAETAQAGAVSAQGKAEAAQAAAEAAKVDAEAARDAALNANTSASAVAAEAKNIAQSANTTADEAKNIAQSAKTFVDSLEIVSGASEDTTVKEEYKLMVGDKQLGDTIKIYKDSSLVSLTLEDKDESGKAGQFLKYTYIDVNGVEKSTYVDVSVLLSQSEFGDGLQVSSAGVVSIKTDKDTESFLTVGNNGLKLSGVQSAIDSAKDSIMAVIGDTFDSDNSVESVIASIQSSLSNVNVKSDDKTVVITKTEDKAEFDVAVNTKVLSEGEKTAGYIEFLKDNNGALYGVMYYGGDDAE